MKIVFDTDVCKKIGKDIDLILYLLSHAAGAKITANTFEKARQQNSLKFNAPYNRANLFPDYVELSTDGEFVVESVLASSNVGGEKSEDRFESLAKKMIECYPEGYKRGSDSKTKMAWRGNPKTIADRLRRFVLKYGDFTDEEFVDATKRYVADNISSPYMRVLLYFIYKNVDGEKQIVNGRVVGDKDRISPLADYLANKEEKLVSDDWDVQLM